MITPCTQSVGNHDLDLGADALATYLEQLHHPAVACNMEMGGHRLGGKIRPWVTKVRVLCSACMRS